MSPVLAADLKALPLSVFAIVLAITLGITYWASKRTSTATEFWAAGRSVTGFQNGWAIAGDYMSASSFLGFAGLIFLFGVDAFVGLMAALVAFVPVLLFFAERMRNSGKYTLADVLAYRLRERPARMAAAVGTLAVSAVYLIAQMVGAGVLIQALTGVGFVPAVIVVGTFMLAYVIFGGMLATTWVQIIKAGLLMVAGVVMTVLVLAKVGFSPLELFKRRREPPPRGRRVPGPRPPVRLVARPRVVRDRLPARHRRAAAHPHALLHGARREGGARLRRLGRRADRLLLPDGHGHRRGRPRDPRRGGRGGRGHQRQPRRADARRVPRGRRRYRRRRDLPRVISAVALATILAVVAGLVITSSGAVAHDLWSNVVRQGHDSEREEVWVAKIASLAIGVLAIVVAIAGGSGFNVTALVGLAFCIAASANFPALLLALFWPRFNTAGAIAGILTGVVSSLVLITMSAPVWPGADSDTGSPLGSLGLDNPAIFTIPLGFLGCWLGTVSARSAATSAPTTSCTCAPRPASAPSARPGPRSVAARAARAPRRRRRCRS